MPLVYGWIRRWGLQESDARDAAQEVFLSVLRNIASVRLDQPAASLRGWLRVVARNEVTDMYRRRQQAVPFSDFDQIAWQVVLDESEENELSLDDEKVLLSRAIEMTQRELAPGTWQMFHELVIEGRAAEQIAEGCGVTTWAVYKAKSRVLARLRELLGDYWKDK
jgi:RNA polymerase sigma-70 factor, ECF subfamily